MTGRFSLHAQHRGFAVDRARAQAVTARELHPTIITYWERRAKMGLTPPTYLTPDEMLILKGDPNGENESDSEAEPTDSTGAEDVGEFGSGVAGGGSLTAGSEDEFGRGFTSTHEGAA